MNFNTQLSQEEQSLLEQLSSQGSTENPLAGQEISKLLEEVLGPSRSVFLRELLWRDIENRQSRDEQVRQDDYRLKNLEDQKVLQEVFEDLRKEEAFANLNHPSKPILARSGLPIRYEKLEEVGRGGVGQVWRVWDRHTRRPLAIKTLRGKFRDNPQINVRLEREAILTGSLQHPGIPPIHDHGLLNDGSVYFAMKLIDGKTLDQILKSDEEKSAMQKALDVFHRVAQTMAYVHSQGVIHRDLKPQNIMVGQFSEVQVMDWGMAKRLVPLKEPVATEREESVVGKQAVERNSIETLSRRSDSSLNEVQPYDPAPELTRVGEVLGTPSYMPPEQARGELNKLNSSADVYSLGAILFEILTGERIHAKESLEGLLEKVSHGDLKLPLEALSQSSCDPQLIDLCKRCLAPDASQRIQSAEEIAEILTAHTVSVQQRIKDAEVERASALLLADEKQKRSRVWIGMSISVALVSVLGLFGFWSQWNAAKASFENSIAENNTRKAVSDFFLNDVIAEVRPAVQPKRNLTMRETLYKAAERIDDRFEDQPEVEAEIRVELALAFLGLGEADAAKNQATKAKELFQFVQGEDSERAWHAYQLIGQAERILENHERALLIQQECCSYLTDQYGADSEQLAIARNELADIFGDLEEFERAASMQVLSNAWWETNQPNGFRYVHGQIQSARWLTAMGRYQQAQDLLLTIQESLLPDWDSLTSELVEGTGTARLESWLRGGKLQSQLHRYLGRPEQAIELLESVIKLSSLWLGPDHPQTKVYEIDLAESFELDGRIDKVTDLIQPILDRMDADPLLMPEERTRVLNLLALSYTREEDFSNAEKILLELRADLVSRFQEPTEIKLQNANSLAVLYAEQSNWRESAKWGKVTVEDALEIYTQRHPQTMIFQIDLANARLELGQIDAAEELLTNVYEHHESVLPAGSPELSRLFDMMAYICDQKNDHETSALWFKRWANFHRQISGPDSMNFHLLIGHHGYHLGEAGEKLEATSVLEKSLSSLEALLDPGDPRLLQQLGWYCENLEATDQIETALAINRKIQAELDQESDRWEWLELESRIGFELHLNKESQLAEEQLLLVFDKQESWSPGEGLSPERQHTAMRETINRLLKIYADLENPEKLKEWTAKRNRLPLHD